MPVDSRMAAVGLEQVYVLGDVAQCTDAEGKVLPGLAQVAQQQGEHLGKALLADLTKGVPVPAFTTALAFYDGYRSERLPANLLQAQRDYFGAHTYERVDRSRGQFFHTNWTGRGGTTASTSYSV